MSDYYFYDKALKALNAAHLACFKHPERGVLGMSTGPFSGVNKALGIVATLEAERALIRAILLEISVRSPGTHNEKCGALARRALRLLERRA